ncbi:hypothetical protein [Sinomicrobium sp. M5D2P17]
MKAFRAHISFSLVAAVLFSILFQAYHVIDHASETPLLLKEKQSTINQSVSKCLVCDFKFSIFNTPEIINFTPQGAMEFTIYINSYIPPALSASGEGIKALRAPPYA